MPPGGKRSLSNRTSPLRSTVASSRSTRYHAQLTRAFHKALNDLLKLRAERRKAEIGFELQKRREAQQQAQAERQKARAEREKINEERRQAAEKRADERHQRNILLTELKTSHQQLLNNELETAAALAKVGVTPGAKVKTPA